MQLSQLLCLSLSFLSLSFAAEPTSEDLLWAMRDQAMKQPASLGLHLKTLYEKNDLNSFVWLMEQTADQKSSDANVNIIQTLLENDERDYLAALLINEDMANQIDMVHDTITRAYRHDVLDKSESEIVDILARSYAAKNLLKFKTVVNEHYFDVYSAGGKLKQLINKLCDDGATQYIRALKNSLINELNRPLHNYIEASVDSRR